MRVLGMHWWLVLLGSNDASSSSSTTPKQGNLDNSHWCFSWFLTVMQSLTIIVLVLLLVSLWLVLFLVLLTNIVSRHEAVIQIEFGKGQR